MKDYFDLLMLVESGLLQSEKLKLTLHTTFEYRNTSLALIPLRFDDGQLAKLQNYWNIFRRNFIGRSNMPNEKFTLILDKINNFMIENVIDFEIPP